MAENFDGVDSGMFGDALDTLGFDGSMTGLQTVWPGIKFHGRALVVRMIVGTPGTFSADEIGLGRILAAASAGDVIVIDAGGAPISVWGELAALDAQRIGVAGLIADAAIRDADIMTDLGFPTLTRHITPTAGKTRLKLDSINEGPVMAGGVTVQPGDFIFADDSGAVVCPQAMVEDTLAEVQKIKEKESEFKKYLAQGLPYLEAAKQLGARQM